MWRVLSRLWRLLWRTMYRCPACMESYYLEEMEGGVCRECAREV